MGTQYATGHGTTILFATSGFVAPMRMVGATQLARGKVERANLTAKRKTYIPEGMSDPGEFDFEFLFDFTAASYALLFPDIDDDAETITISFEDFGYATPAKLAGSGFFTAVSSPELASDALAVGAATIAWAGGADSPALSEASS